MSVIGIELENESLVLTRGRDFKWAFENIDENDNPIPYPAGQLYFELATGGASSAHQILKQTGAAGGTSTLAIPGYGTTVPIAYNNSEGGVKSALEALPGIGVGNVKVTAKYTPQWFYTTNFSAIISLSPQITQAADDAINAVFDAVEWLAGHTIQLDGFYTATSFTFKVTLLGFFLEPAFVDFIISSVASLVNSALNAIAPLTGKILTVTEIYAPVREFQISFVNELANTPIPKIIPTSSLTGYQPSLSVFQTDPGKSAVTKWPFTVDGSLASLKIENPAADAIPERTKWQLVFLPSGEPAGGDPIAIGRVKVQT